MAVTERLAIVVEADASKGIAQFKQLGVAAKSVGGPIGEAGGLMQKATGQLSGLASAAGPAAFLAIGAALVKFGQVGVDAFQSLAGEVKQFRQVAGGTPEDASKLVAAFNAVGIGVDAAATGIFQLEKRIGTSGATLAQFGVQVVRDSKGNTDMSATLLNVADAYQRTTDPAARAQLGVAAFGRQVVTMTPLLAKGKDGIKELFAEAERHHLILSAEDLQRAADLKIAMRDLGEAVQGLQVEAGRGLVPAITQVVGLLNVAAGLVGDVVSGPPGGSKGGWWDKVTSGTHILIADLFDVGGASHSASAALGQLNVDATDLGKALQTSVGSDRSLSAAHRTLDADNRALAADTKSYNELLAQGAVDAKKVADATRSLDDATRSVGHAQREQGKAQDEYNKALATANILGTDTAKGKLTDASNKLADANDSVASALDRQKSASAALATAKAGDPDYQDKLAAAKQKVADDTQSIADAEYNVGTNALANVAAHNAEATAIAGKSAAAEQLLADYAALIAQHPDVAAALAPQIPALAAAASAGDIGNILTGTALPKTPATGGGAGGGTSTVGKVAGVVINIAKSVEDPSSIARSVIWHLGL